MKSLSNDKKPIRYRKYFWEYYQERLNELLLIINVGDRKSCVMSLTDDKKHADFTGKDHVRCHEGLKCVIHPNLRKGIIGHTAMSPFTNLAYAISWEKAGQTTTDCYINIIIMMCGSKLNLDRIMFCSDRGHWNINLVKYTSMHGGHLKVM